MCQPIHLADANGTGGIITDDVSVYAADPDLSRVLSVPKVGGASKELATLQKGPNAPVVDGTALYWCDIGGTSTTPGASIMRLRAGDAEPAILADHEETPNGLVIDGEYAYWTDASVTAGAGRVSRVALVGGTTEDLAKGLYSPFGLAADKDNLYWTDYAKALSLVDGRVVTMPKTGGTVRVLVEGQVEPGRVQVDDTYVYWLTRDISEGGIYRVAKGGGSVETIAARERGPRDLVVDTGRAYWVTSFSAVRTVPLAGGVVQTLFTDPSGAMLLAMAQDDRALYWASDRIELSTVEAAIWKVAKPVALNVPPRMVDAGAPADVRNEEAPGDSGGSNLECLPDGSGRFTLATQGGLVVDLREGNAIYCAGSGILTRAGYDLVMSDIPLAGGPTRLTTTVRVTNGLTSKTGLEDVVVKIMTYSDPSLSDAKYWSGSCTANITTNEQIASNTVYLTYKVAGTVSCLSPLGFRTADGNPGTGESVQITNLDVVTSVLWGFD